MSNNLGGGVSRVLNPAGTGFVEVVWQQGRPPCDAELNLGQEIAGDWQRRAVLSGTPSGWLSNETNAAQDFVTSAIWSNWFKFGRQATTSEKSPPLWAVVNGWLIPVTGTKTGSPPGSPDDTDTWNLIALDPPPSNSGDFRIDYVFLEVWLARVPPNPSTLNKPRADSVYRYGNVEGGANFIADDIIDPALGFETTQRVQLQYRIRVVKGLIGLATNPDGFDPNVVKAQGAATAPITGTNAIFVNMRSALGDPGLWRAGDGTANALGTVDGYTYAIPIATVFRRNSVAWAGHPSQNLNGGFNRNPLATDRSGILTFSVTGGIADTTPAIPVINVVGGINATQLSFVITPYANIQLPASPASAVLIKVGDELMRYQSITVLGGVATITLTERGSNGTRAEAHANRTPVTVVSNRPDGLFSDQIAATDILDLRHAVNPNGFNYETLLKSNLDKLLRGQLRANWKRSGVGPQGPFVHYQDMIGISAGTGITKLDAPDGIRYVFSDAAVPQKVEFLLEANGGPEPSSLNDIWTPGNYITAYEAYNPGGDVNGVLPAGATHSSFAPGDTITLTLQDLRAGLPGGDADQVRWLDSTTTGAVVLQVEGETDPVSASLYSTSYDLLGNLVITLGTHFPTVTQPKRLKLTATVQYGPGRGLSRRADSIHSLSFTDVSLEYVTHHSGVPDTDFKLRTAWAPLWSKFRSATYKGLLPVTAEAYADLGSKTIVLQPLGRIEWPQTDGIRTMDGTTANLTSTIRTSGVLGQATTATTTFQDLSGVNFTIAPNIVNIGDALVITNGPQPGRYTVLTVAANTLTVDRNFLPPTGLTGLHYTVYKAQGLMPTFKRDGTTPKWTTTDPLEVFSGSQGAPANTKNMYVNLPRHMVPGWGEFRLPIYTAEDVTQNSQYAEGINFMSLSVTGAAPFTDSDKNYVPYYFQSGSSTMATFTTWNNVGAGSTAPYNAKTGVGNNYCGMRKFTDTRGFGRKGLELPPFYGIARLFAVYEAHDYFTNHSAYNAFTRVSDPVGHAVNLLRQDFDGPVFWVEIDSDGDSTFILNADAIDTTRSVFTPLASFDAGEFVIEASIFGFDRDAFDITKEFRLVLTRAGTTTLRSQAINAIRASNINIPITGGIFLLPAPAAASSIVVNYSRTPYQGDAFGTQAGYQDIQQATGPLTTSDAWAVFSTVLDPTVLTRPNQKPLEVLASAGFSTTLGTGRISGDADNGMIDMRNIGYEDMAVYPPASSIADRPATFFDAFLGDTSILQTGTDYLGCTERLPLGSLFRDKDFRGNVMFGAYMTSALLYWEGETGLADFSSLSATQWLEQAEINLSAANVASGQPGEVVVHVDGNQNQSNWSLLTNYRTFRGGSAFTASGSHPGGEVAGFLPDVTGGCGHMNTLHGKAFLVRNEPTMYGASEASPGDELLMLVVTTVVQHKNSSRTQGYYAIGTNGTMEGYSAADLYRIEGRPLVNDNVRLSVNPSSIALSNKVG